MRISEFEANKLFPALFDKDKAENFKLTPTRKYRRYEEADRQKGFIAAISDWRVKGLFRTVPGLVHISWCAIPQFYSPMKTPQQRQQAMIRGQRNKELGYQKSWPDITFIWSFQDKGRDFGLLEMKSEGGSLDPDQKKLHAQYKEHGYLIEVAHTKEEGFKALKKWGLLPPCFEGQYV